MKRIIVAAADFLGCGYYRLAMPYNELSKKGFEVLLTNRIDNIEYNFDNDVLVLQRQHKKEVIDFAENLQKRGVKIVSELDDFLQGIPLNNPAHKAYPKGGKEIQNLEYLLKISDLVTVSTPDLAKQYSKFNNNVKICYNSLDSNKIQDFNKDFHKDGVIRLGWAGSGTHHDDFITIIKPVTEVMREHKNVRFVFIGQDYKKLFPLDIQSRMEYAGHTFPLKNGKALFVDPDGNNPVYDYYELIKKANLDLAIAPIAEVTFNRCKSYVKLLEYGMLKVPFVASNFGPYFEFGQGKSSFFNKENSIGFLANKNPEWKKYLSALITDKNLCEKIAYNNYENVKYNHSIEKNCQQWLDALETIDVKPSGLKGSYEERLVKA